MTYPVDDNGNVRVDFAWGNVPMQPDDQRTDLNADWVGDNNQSGDRGWTAPSYGATSDTLATTEHQNLSIGDHDNYNDSWDDVSTRQVTVPTAHDIATAQYNGFPGLNYGSPYGDTIPNVTVPNVVDFDSVAAATAYLQNAGLTVGVVTQTEVGATSGNNDWVKSQSIAPGTLVNAGTAINLVKYHMAGNPILAMQYDMMGSMMGGGSVKMIIPGQVNKPAVGDIITVTGNARSDFNTSAVVVSVVNDDAYTTGSTKVGLSMQGGGDINWNVGGLWVALPHSLPMPVTLPRNTMGGNPYTYVNNSGVGGRIKMVVDSNSPAYKYLIYSGASADNNGYAGKTITFSDMMESVMAGMSTAPYAPLNGTKTVYSSDAVAGMMGGFQVEIILDDTTDVTPGGASLYREVFGSAVVNA